CLLVGVRQLAKVDLDRIGLAIVPDTEFHGLAGRFGGDQAGKFLGRVDILAVHLRDDVAGNHARLLGRAVVLGVRHKRALLRLQAERFGDIGGDWLYLNAEPAALDRAVLYQILNHRLGRRGRNVEGDADITARRREDGGVDADDFAAEIKGRAARIAAVDRGVDLDEIVIGAGADIAAPRRDDAGRDRPAQSERITHGHDPVADARLGIVAEGNVSELLVAIDLQYGEIGARVGADQLSVE